VLYPPPRACTADGPSTFVTTTGDSMDDDTDDGRDRPPAPGASGPAARHESRLRRLAGGREPYRGPIVAARRAWVSQDTRLRFLAARFLDFAVITDEHLVLCSTGFVTRRPRRRVFKEPLAKLTVIGRGSHPERTLRVLGDLRHPILLELRADPSGLAFARELLARTRPAIDAAAGDDRPGRDVAGAAP
jgi:hypothetical protein